MEKKLLVTVTARMNVIAQIKGHELLFPEMFMHTFDLNEKSGPLFKDQIDVKQRRALKQIINALAETEARSEYVNHIVERLRTEPKAKMRVGGTRWSVNVLEFSWSMPGDPLGLMENAPFKKTKHDKRRQCSGRLFEQKCTADVQLDHGVNGSGFCPKCYFPGVEAAYKKYKEDRTAGASRIDAAKNNGLDPYPFVKRK